MVAQIRHAASQWEAYSTNLASINHEFRCVDQISVPLRQLTLIVVWIGKALGCLAFEPLVRRVGYKKVMCIALILQTVGVIGQSRTLACYSESPLTDSGTYCQRLDHVFFWTGRRL